MTGTNCVAEQPLPKKSLVVWTQVRYFSVIALVRTENYDVLTLPIERVIPLRRMKYRALEAVLSRNVTRLRDRQRAHGRNQDLSCPNSFGFSSRVHNRDFPYFINIIPFRLFDYALKPDFLENPVLFCYLAEVGLNLWAHGVLAAPIGVEREAVRVEM